MLTQPENQNLSENLDLQQYIIPSQSNQVYFPGLGSVITPANTPVWETVQVSINGVQLNQNSNISLSRSFIQMASPSGFWKLTALTNNGTYGRSTSVVYKNSGSISDAITVGKTWCNKLSNLYGATYANGSFTGKNLGTPVIEWMRVSDAQNPRISQLVSLGGSYNAGYPTNGGNSAADVLSTALSIKVVGLNSIDNATTSRSSHQITGQPDNAVQVGAYVGSISMTLTQTLDNLIADYLNYLCAPGSVLGFMGKSVTEPTYGASGFLEQANGTWNLTVANQAYNPGDKIRITKAKARQLNGVWTINSTSAGGILNIQGPSTITAYTGGASVQRIQLANGVKVNQFYQFQPPLGGWSTPFGIKVTKKNLGRQFLGVVFPHRVKHAK